MAVDPVCGMEVNEQSSTNTSTYGGKTFHFCSEECKEKFDANPQQYTQAA
ncbi:MAG: YHS domain-containing protein [Acidobacteriales bacterium]|nr:YHS domain-containing protein [Terriglobales bacterium]